MNFKSYINRNVRKKKELGRQMFDIILPLLRALPREGYAVD